MLRLASRKVNFNPLVLKGVNGRVWNSTKSKRLVPDPMKVPRTKPIDLTKEAFKKTNTIEDYSIYDVNAPPNNIDSILVNGFRLANGAKIVSTAEKPTGLILLGHEAFEVDLTNAVEGLDGGRVEFSDSILGVFDVVYPKPELLVVGLGVRARILGPKTHDRFRQLGIQVSLGSTRDSASNFDLLASERGNTVASFLLPPNV